MTAYRRQLELQTLQRCHYTAHHWRAVGISDRDAPGTDMRYVRLWRCEKCGKEWELLDGLEPLTGMIVR